MEGLGRGEPARAVAVPALAPNAPAELQALSSKPVLYVANLDEGEGEPPATLVEHARRQDAGCIGVSARIEAELAELPAAEAGEMRSELGLAESGLERLLRAAYELLDLVTFFTAHRGSEARARALRRGLTAWDAAGKVHAEIQAGFVRAEVIGWRELVDAGGYGEARERGLIRTEGREYVVRGRRRDHDSALSGALRRRSVGSLTIRDPSPGRQRSGASVTFPRFVCKQALMELAKFPVPQAPGSGGPKGGTAPGGESDRRP